MLNILEIVHKTRRLLFSKVGASGMIYVGTNFFNAALPFFLLPILTSKLVEEEYGIVVMVTVLVSILNPFISLGTSGAISRVFFREEIKNFPQYVGNCIIIALIAFFVVTCLIYIISPKFVQVHTGIPPYWYMVCSLIALEIYIVEVRLSIYRIKFQSKLFALFKVFQTIATFLLTYILVVNLELSWKGVILAKVVVLSLASLFAFLLLHRDKLLAFKLNRVYIKDALLFGIPLLPHLLAGFIISASDRIFITNFKGAAETGSYNVAYQIGSIVDLLNNSLNLAWGPWLFSKLKNFETHRALLRKITSISIFVILLISGFFVLISPIIVHFFVDSSFNISYSVINVVILAFVFQGFYLLFVNYLFFSGDTKVISTISIFIAVLNLLLNFYMIKHYGVIGGAIATAVCFFLKFILIFLKTNHKFRLYKL